MFLTTDVLQTGIIALLAFYVAWNLGANDVANSMGTSVGSKVLTLRQAVMVAGVLEFTGAVLFGNNVSQTLATNISNPELFAATPQVFLVGMISVLISCGVWLQLATRQGWPVSSSHAVVGAIAGFSWIAGGLNAVDWRQIGIISITWLLTPFVSGLIASGLYSLIKYWILDHPDPLRQLQDWIPWLSSALLGVFGVIVLPSILETPWINSLQAQLGWTLPDHDMGIGIGGIAAITLTLISWRHLEVARRGKREEGGTKDEAINAPLPPSPSSLIAHTLEQQLGRFQILSACFVAFAHGSNDVGNAIAPLVAITYVRRTGMVPLGEIEVPLWVLVLGGIGIVMGLATWGKKVIATVGENIISLRPSGGFCAELATAITVLLASRFGLPVSTSHALVGGVMGIGFVQGFKSIRFQTVRSIALAWFITIPIASGLAAGVFTILNSRF